MRNWTIGTGARGADLRLIRFGEKFYRAKTVNIILNRPPPPSPQKFFAPGHAANLSNCALLHRIMAAMVPRSEGALRYDAAG
jgi:hypothetical protein